MGGLVEMKGILCFGDSITLGRGEKPNYGWVGRLKEDYEKKGNHNSVFNLGIGGDSSKDLLKRISSEIKARVSYRYPDDYFLILIAIGINDSRGLGNLKNVQIKTSDYGKNLKKIIQISKKYSKNIAVIGLTPVNENKTMPYEDTYFSNEVIKKYNKIAMDVSKKNRVVFIDLMNSILKIKYSNMLEDGLHPNKKGYSFMYENIKSELNKNKMLK